MTNWLTFSLSPMEMLKSPDQSHFASYDASSTPYLIDNFYVFKEEAETEEAAASMADSTILSTFYDSHIHSQSQIPKLEDFLGDSFVRYSDTQTETLDSSSLTRFYDLRHHTVTGGDTGFFSDHDRHDFKTVNSGSEIVDHSASNIGGTRPSGHVVKSSTTAELGFNGGASATTGEALSLAVKNTSDQPLSCNNGERGENSNKTTTVSKKETSDDSKKKIVDTLGQRTSIYRGVTR